MTDSHPNKVVTRFAPSPTGFLHVGGVRTAIYAWAYARKFGADGTFILRIEDTDKEREVEGSIDHIIESLKWLGINWNEGPDIGGPHGPYIQSGRLDSYRKYAHKLIEAGFAYVDTNTTEELEALRKKSEEEKKPFLFRDYRPAHADAKPGSDDAVEWIDEDGKRKPLRLKITDIKTSEWHDLVRGDLSAGPEALDDFILIKSDGYPTYNFAHIIDDLEMGATHIFRADEFISSVPKFLALYDALQKSGVEITRPAFAILPPIMGPDGKKKLSKRDGAKDILDYRNEGYLPEAIVNFLAFIGWNPGDDREIFTPEELIKAFDISHVQAAGAKLNEEKLLWTNKEHLNRLSATEWEEKFLSYIKGSASMLAEFTNHGIDEEKINSPIFKAVMHDVLRERLNYFGEVKTMLENGELDYFFFPPLDNPNDDGASNMRAGALTPDEDLIKKTLICPEKMWKNGTGEKIEVNNESTAAILRQVIEILEKHADASNADTGNNADDSTQSQTGNWSKEKIKEILWPFAEHEGRGVVLWPMRVALSGKDKSPDPFVLASILGFTETISRLKQAVEIL